MNGLTRRLGENEVQSAIRASLEVYADRHGFAAQFFEPYANQQGAGPQRFGADLLGILDNSRVVMLEIKALDVLPYRLIHFDEDQHADCCDLEAFGVPIAYAFNATESLAYYNLGRQPNWPIETLRDILRAQPTRLPGEAPDRHHPSLLSWLESGTDTNVGEQLGGLLGGSAVRPRVLTNAVLALVYSASAGRLMSFDPNHAQILINALNSLDILSARHERRRLSLFQSIAKAAELLHPSDDADDDASTNHYRPPPRGPRP